MGQDTAVHVPSLVCAATSNCDELFHFEGTTFNVDAFDWLRELAQDFKLTVLAQKLQGFDSYLMLDELYKQYIVHELTNSQRCQDPVPLHQRWKHRLQRIYLLLRPYNSLTSLKRSFSNTPDH